MGGAATPTDPHALLARITADAGGSVDGLAAGTLDGAPDVTALSEPRAIAVLAAWSGACLHAGLPAGLTTDDPDLALLAGDWCFAHALQALAHRGDLPAIGVLAQAIGECALVLGEPGGAALLGEVWARACSALQTA